jgi:DNA-binding XRE family transcriptional regulator
MAHLLMLRMAVLRRAGAAARAAMVSDPRGWAIPKASDAQVLRYAAVACYRSWMTRNQFRSALRKLSITQAKAAVMLGVSLRSVNGYANGKTIPKPVARLLLWKIKFSVMCYAEGGHCSWIGCPQLRDDEPRTSGRLCPRLGEEEKKKRIALKEWQMKRS